MLKILFVFLLITTGSVFANDPEEVLDQYFKILTKRDFSGFGDIMAAAGSSACGHKN